MTLNAQGIIQQLDLEAHPIEGGYFKRTYCSELYCYYQDKQKRSLMSSIYYLLSQQSPIGYLHRNKSDIMHYFHSGNPIDYYLLDDKQRLQHIVLGADILAGQQCQLLVKANTWKASELCSGVHDYGLISEAVSPGFEYCDNEIATTETMRSYPDHIQQAIHRFIKS